MIIADFTNCAEDTVTASGVLYQYDYNQKLKIQGLNIAGSAQVHFSFQQSFGEAVRIIGEAEDGDLTVQIPNFLLKGFLSCQGEYYIWAFVYVADWDAGETINRIRIRVIARPRPQDYSEPEYKDALDQITESLAAKLDKNQGTENAGKVLGIGQDGMVIPQDVQAGGFWVTITEDENNNENEITGTSDKTFDEIKAAYDAGRPVYAKLRNFVLPLTEVNTHEEDQANLNNAVFSIVSDNEFGGNRGFLSIFVTNKGTKILWQNDIQPQTVTGDMLGSDFALCQVAYDSEYNELVFPVAKTLDPKLPQTGYAELGILSVPPTVDAVREAIAAATPFYVDITMGSDGQAECSVTYQEILSAYNEGAKIQASIQGFPAAVILQDNMFVFSAGSGLGIINVEITPYNTLSHSIQYVAETGVPAASELNSYLMSKVYISNDQRLYIPAISDLDDVPSTDTQTITEDADMYFATAQAVKKAIDELWTHVNQKIAELSGTQEG